MNRLRHTRLTRGALWLWIVVLLLQTATACRSVPSAGEEHSTSSDQTAIHTGSGNLTLESAAPPDEPEDEMPPIMALDPEIDYTPLLINSYYAAGKVAGKALVASSYVEMYNGSDIPVSLSGLSLYVSDNGGVFTEYRFSPEAVVPAKGFFLVKGREIGGAHEDALTVEHYDASFSTLSPDPNSTRILLAAAGRTLPADMPLSLVEGLFSYVTADAMDAEDTCHYIGSASVNKVIRKKANTHKVDYHSIHLGKASYTVLSQIRPKTAEGDVNTTVRTLMDEVVFSHETGVYAEGFELTMTAPEGYTIYYSINGSAPRIGFSMAYQGPIRLTDTTNAGWGDLTSLCGAYLGTNHLPLVASQPGAVVVRAFAVREADGSVTPLTTHTYLIGEIYAEWGVDIVSVSVDANQFIGVDGIYNTLRTDSDGGHSHIPAYVEFISPEGKAVHMGWAEIAMNGRGSLGMTQRSFRILLKSQVMDTENVHENLNTLNYDLYKEYASSTPDGERVTWYRHILLRNGGGDMSGSTISRSHIGDAYIQRLDRVLIPDVMAYAPVMTFINGEFWGTFNARDRMDPKYFEGKYGIAEEDFALLECPYPLTFGWNVDFTAANGDPAEATYFMELVNFCMQNDMSVQANYDYIAERIDLDGLIDQYCAQIYLCCSDWPSNNIKVWRNTNPDHPTMDTKWHFTIVDTDHGVGLNSDIYTNLWGVVNDGPVLSRIVNHMLQNKDFRERFQMRYIWCMEVAFAPERMHAELDTLIETIRPVMQYQLDRFRCTNGERTSWDTWYSYIETIHHFADNRYAPAKEQFKSWAGINDAYYRYLKNRAIEEWGSEVS